VADVGGTPLHVDVEVSLTVEDDDAGSIRVHMEPEEARQLARHLIEAAEEWERCRAVVGAGRG
jgi:hypothetical protein